MTAAHTPGPWRVWGSARTTVSTAGEFRRIADCMDEENARLIAAAPEMLQALKMFLAEKQHVAPTMDIYALHSVIAKAEGRSS